MDGKRKKTKPYHQASLLKSDETSNDLLSEMRCLRIFSTSSFFSSYHITTELNKFVRAGKM